MTLLDPLDPGGSLYRAAMLDGRVTSLDDLAALRSVTRPAVSKMIRGGAGVRVETLTEYAAALGYKLVLGIEPAEK